MKRTSHRLLAFAASLALFLAQAPPLAASVPTPSGQSPDAGAWPADFPLASAGLPFEGPILLNGAAPGAHSVLTADFDNDGDLDAVSAERGTTTAGGGRVVWYRSDGGPTPGFEVRLVADVPGAYLALPADVNEDGKSDIVVAAVTDLDPSAASPDATPTATGAVYWFQNDGQPVPGFIQRTVATGLAYSVAVRVADLDGDGDADIVVAARESSDVYWYAGSGGSVPTFVQRTLFSGADGPVSVDIGDVDNDGDPDVVTASENDDRIYWHANNGAGVFTAFPIRIGVAQGEFDFAKSVRLTDVEGDGDLDLVYASEDQNQAGIYLSNGANPPQFTQRVLDNERRHIKQVNSADLDNDGDMDLLAASSDDSTVAWYRNNGAADPQFTRYLVTTSASGARFVHSADLDGDGDQDLLVASRVNGQVVWFRNRLIHRSAHFPPQAHHVLGVYLQARHLTSDDLDGDGDRDILTIGERDLVWYENNGTTPPGYTPHPIAANIGGGRWAEIGDLDGDGDNDLLAASTDNNTIFWYENNGASPPAFAERVVSNSLRGPRSVLSDDLDGDGDLDIFAAFDGDGAPGAARVAWFQNNGASPPTFTLRVVDDSVVYTRSVFAADMDRDGDLDLLAADQRSGESSVLIYENQGGSTPAFARRVVGRAAGAQHVHAGDIDGDGDPDVAVASEYDNSVRVFFNLDGLGRSFAPLLVDGAASAVHAVFMADVDGDGDKDLLAALESANLIVWYENNGQPQPGFVRRTLYDQAWVAHAVSADDLDGDGDMDVLAAAREAGLFVWLENRGGQYRFGVGDAALFPGPQGRPRLVRSLTFTHLGRPGDPALQPDTLDLRFVNNAGQPLTVAETAGQVAAVSAYLDSNSNGRLDAPDRLLASETNLNQAAGGRLLLPMNVSAPPPVNLGESVTFFAVADLTGVCGTGGVQMNVHGGAQTAVDALAGSPLLAESMVALGALPQPVVVDGPRQLRINEVSANPSVIDDWLEIYNAGAVAVDLGGMYLTDDLGNPTKHRIPDGIVIGPRRYLVFIADGQNGPLHLSFGLSSGGESLGLFDSATRANRLLDSITYGPQQVDQSSGRMPDGGAQWQPLLGPSPGSTNVLGGLDEREWLPIISKGFGC